MNGLALRRCGAFSRITALAMLCIPGGMVGAQDGVSPAILLTFEKGHARLETVPDPFETVIVGDPAIVTTSVVSDTRLVLTARAVGRTNIIVLGADGSVQAQWDVVVPDNDAHHTTVYRGMIRSVVACNPICQPVPTLENAEP